MKPPFPTQEGFDELPSSDRSAVVAHAMDKAHWAKLVRRAPKDEPSMLRGAMGGATSTSPPPPPPPRGRSSSGGGAARGTALVPADRQVFVVPTPARCPNASACAGKTFVTTGVFPEVGGGVGLNLGKDRVKKMIESFGGRVTGSVSGKTDYLVVGKEPGMSKVSQARDRGVDLATTGAGKGCFNVTSTLESGSR